MTHYRALARRVQARILARHAHYDDALRAIDEAIASFARCGSRLELARARYHRAAIRRTREAGGGRDAIRADALEARDAFTAMGAVRDRAMAEELLNSERGFRIEE